MRFGYQHGCYMIPSLVGWAVRERTTADVNSIYLASSVGLPTILPPEPGSAGFGDLVG
jgi:hypothetical protein